MANIGEFGPSVRRLMAIIFGEYWYLRQETYTGQQSRELPFFGKLMQVEQDTWQSLWLIDGLLT
jgi:hypothetical protein